MFPCASESSCDRALQKRCLEERLVRISKGIYAIGQARMADLIPEVMPKLGYQILAGQTPKGYSQYCGGRVWRLDRACHRRIRRQGVYAYFETPGGEIVDPKDLKESTHTLPTQQEVEENYHSYIHCHSMARAEKELIVKQAVAAFESFEDERCTLALTGGTSLAFYHRLLARFSEDIDIQFVLREDIEKSTPEERATQILDIGQRFLEHIHSELPYLVYRRKKGRIQKQGKMQSFIFDYESNITEDDSEVLKGIKFELVDVQIFRSLVYRRGKSGSTRSIRFAN